MTLKLSAVETQDTLSPVVKSVHITSSPFLKH